jgi:hypothetical protein
MRCSDVLAKSSLTSLAASTLAGEFRSGESCDNREMTEISCIVINRASCCPVDPDLQHSPRYGPVTISLQRPHIPTHHLPVGAAQSAAGPPAKHSPVSKRRLRPSYRCYCRLAVSAQARLCPPVSPLYHLDATFQSQRPFWVVTGDIPVESVEYDYRTYADLQEGR